MPTPSAFNEERRDKILQTLRMGASRRTAATVAGVDHRTLGRWIDRGKDASEGTRFRVFHDQVQEAEATARVRALSIVYNEMPDNPMLAWRFLERKEPGFAPPSAALGMKEGEQ
jgi:hypothetical protein